MATTEALRARLLDLRQSFDRAFSEPIAEQAARTVELLTIRVGREAFALRMSEIGALEADRTITAVPSDQAELLGISGVRGGVVAVFDLALLLDLPRSESTRWLVLAKGAPLAFAFSGFEGQHDARPEDFASAEAGRDGRARDVVHKDGLALPVIDLTALVAALERRPRLKEEHVI
jgi:chemotaxis signal transduction protein